MSPCTKTILSIPQPTFEGCGSNLDEIVDWTRMTEKNKKFLLDCLKTEIIMWEGENIY